MNVKKLVIAGVTLCMALTLPLGAWAQNPDTAWREGYKAYENQNWAQAESLFRSALQQGGEAYERWGWLHMVLGVTLYHRSKHSEAISELQTAKELVAEDAERFQVNHALAQVYLGRGNSGDYDRAVAAENEASQYASGGQQRAVVAKTLGQAYYYKEDWGRATTQLENASRTLSADATVFSMLGRANFERGQFDGAMEAFRTALRHDSGNRQALLYAARIYLDRRDYDQAVSMAERAIAADPQNTTTRSMLGRAYLGARRYRDAIQQFEQVVQGTGTSKGPSYYNLGQAYQATEDDGRAIDSYTSALGFLAEGSATRAECLYDLGFVYEKVGDYESALQALEASSAITQQAKVTEAIERVRERIRRQKESG